MRRINQVRKRRDLAARNLRDFWRALQRGIKPDPRLTVSEWSDKYRILSSRSASEAGPYRTSRTPYLKDIMDALSPQHPAINVIFMKAAQVGATEAGNNWIGYCIHQAPGPFLAVEPTTELAKRLSQQRIEPLIEESSALRELISPARKRDSGNTVLAKRFPGGQLVLTGANSAVGLRSMPVRWLFLDEVDAYVADVDEEGDPVSLAEARTQTFGHRRKIFKASTPTLKGFSRIEREYEASNQLRYFVPCPHCDAMQWLKFERLRWTKGDVHTVRYHCEDCEKPIAEQHKTQMLERGEWRPMNMEPVDQFTIGFHISGLYSPVGWLSWAQVAQQWEAAQGNDAMLKAFKNTVLGETWQERGDAPEWSAIYNVREQWKVGTVPMGGLFLTAGVDVQKDRLEIDVWAWGRGSESWLIDHIVLEGGPDKDETWTALDDLMKSEWLHESGHPLRIARLCIDTGYGSATVHTWARKQGFATVSPVKGTDTFNPSSPVSGPTYIDVTIKGKRLRRGTRLWMVGVSTFKSETYRFLRLDRPTDEEKAVGVVPPSGTIHLPGWVDSEWIKQFVAEQLVSVKNRRGFSKLEWQKIRERNEALDCRVYARAAAWIAGIDRMKESQWRQLEAQFGIEAQAPKPAPAPLVAEAKAIEEAEATARPVGAPLPARRSSAPTGRRVSRSSYLA